MNIDRDAQATKDMAASAKDDIDYVTAAARDGRLMCIAWERRAMPDREKKELDPDHDPFAYGDVIQVTFTMRPVR
jgi:hypothetical protein